MLDVEEGEILETTAEERKAVEDSHRVFIREAEKGIQLNACMQLTETKCAGQCIIHGLFFPSSRFFGGGGRRGFLEEDSSTLLCNRSQWMPLPL
jgi:hypothetical protein